MLIVCVVQVLLVQLSWFWLRAILADPFRCNEKIDGCRELDKGECSESKSVFDYDRRLLCLILRPKALLAFNSFLVVDVAGIYYMWNCEIRRQRSS